ncbi:MAG: MFS transporter [Hyphomicrobiales bacterium]|nr:MFS transporter [Hyphomicrobiales bacterium]
MIFTPARLIMVVFVMHSFILTNWFTRIPDMKAKLLVGTGELSLGLVGASIGTLVCLPLAGQIVERLSARRTILVAFTLYALAFAMVGWAWSVPTLFVALFVGGLFLPVVDVAMNIEADRIEGSIGRGIMNTCHGFWSVGSVLGGLSGSAFASLQVDIRWHMLIVGAVAVPIVLSAALRLPKLSTKLESTGSRPVRIALPTRALWPLCIFGFCMLLVEAAALDWSTLFMRSVMGSTPFFAGFGFAAFTVAMAVGRFLGDWAAGRFGPVAVARTCGVIGLAGLIILVTAPIFIVAVIGLAAIGLGVSVAVPLAVSAAASRSDRPAPVNVAALLLVAFSGFLVDPPLVGYSAEFAGSLRIGIAMVIPAMVVSILLAGHVRRSGKAPTPPNPLSELAT